MTSLGWVPFASVCPCARCVEAITSPSSSARQTPTATASWPMATWRKPGSSPARKRSSTFSSNRRMSSISRKKSRRSSGESVPFFSTLAIPVQSMLGPVRLADQFRELESRLPGDWADVRVALVVDDSSQVERERIRGQLELVTYSAAVPEPPEPRAAWPPLEEAWLSAVAALPEDWSDIYAEVELGSSADLDRGALRLAPVNPSRPDRGLAFKFRVARTFGYGASPEMTRRCLARLDEGGIKGRLLILWALSDTKAVATQGPVWYGEGGPL